MPDPKRPTVVYLAERDGQRPGDAARRVLAAAHDDAVAEPYERALVLLMSPDGWSLRSTHSGFEMLGMLEVLRGALVERAMYPELAEYDEPAG